MKKEVQDCFLSALRDEAKGKKHKGLFLIHADNKRAVEFLAKAKLNLELCDMYKEKGFDYKIPEEWFYTLYYCALAILSRFGVESRSQRCTASFLRYIQAQGLIEYDDEFIDRITVHSSKGKISDVDERETARYSSAIKSQDVTSRYAPMTLTCKRAISQCEEIVFSNKEFTVPRDLFPLEKLRGLGKDL